MKEIRSRLKKSEHDEIEFDLPLEKVAHALDISPEELMEAIKEDKIRYRKVTNQDGSVVIQVEAFARHCTVTVQPKR